MPYAFSAEVRTIKQADQPLDLNMVEILHMKYPSQLGGMALSHMMPSEKDMYCICLCVYIQIYVYIYTFISIFIFLYMYTPAHARGHDIIRGSFARRLQHRLTTRKFGSCTVSWLILIHTFRGYLRGLQIVTNLQLEEQASHRYSTHQGSCDGPWCTTSRRGLRPPGRRDSN